MNEESRGSEQTAPNESGAAHPAGSIELAPRHRYGLRAAALAGLTLGLSGIAAVTTTLDPGSTGTVSSIVH